MKRLRLFIMLAIFALPVGGFAAATDREFEAFREFLEQSLQKHPAGRKDIDAFYKGAFAFWNKHLEDYLDHPERYRSLLFLYYRDQAFYPLDMSITDIDRFKGEIEKFRRMDAKNTVPSNAVLFVGSSSIVFWETAVAFPSYPVINRGFGGSTLAEVNHFYNDVVQKYHPAVIVLYCDNDVFMGEESSVAVRRFEEFADRVAKELPAAKLLFLSMKPAPIDDFISKNLRRNEAIANQLIKEFIETRPNMRFADVATPMFNEGKLRFDIFRSDGEHLNATGYGIWNPIVAKQLSELYVGTAGVADRK